MIDTDYLPIVEEALIVPSHRFDTGTLEAEQEPPRFEHTFEPGDHVIRWEMLPIVWPIQIHGIVLETGPDYVKLADFGLTATGVNDDVKSKESSNVSNNNDADSDDVMGANEQPNGSTIDSHGINPHNNSSTTGENQVKEDAESVALRVDEVVAAAWGKHRLKTRKQKNRLNVITITDKKELVAWRKVNYGGNIFGLGGTSNCPTPKEENINKSSWWNWGSLKTKSFGVDSDLESPTNYDNTNKEKGSNKIDDEILVTGCAELKLEGIANVAADRTSSQKLSNNSSSENAPSELIPLTITTSTNGQKIASTTIVVEDDDNREQIKSTRDEKPEQMAASATEPALADVATTATKVSELMNVSQADEGGKPKTLEELIAEASQTDRTTQRSKVVYSPQSSNPQRQQHLNSFASLWNPSASFEAKEEAVQVSGATSGGGSKYVQKEESSSSSKLLKQRHMNPAISKLLLENKEKQASPSNANDPNKLPQSDPSKLVIARARFLLEYGESVLPPYHLFYSNSECIAVFCKTGVWSTLQASVFLYSTAIGNAKSTTVISLGMAASAPLLVPAIAMLGLGMVGAPYLILKKSREKWEEATRTLTDLFWKQAEPDVFVQCIEQWSKVADDVSNL